MIKFKTNKKWDKPFSERIAKRVSRIPTVDLTTWADQSIYALGRSLSTFERERSEAAMKELADGAEALHAVVHELNKRMNNTL